ncbi:hypothetical protein DFH09DRAFT_1289547 [Mycena vulgaris]|nr:hypothetical protein DFH09DRAFT_1289547 [Mycena vulgaris]
MVELHGRPTASNPHPDNQPNTAKLLPHSAAMSAIGPALPPHLLARPDTSDADDDAEEAPPARRRDDEDDSEDDYAPALPPDMLASSSAPKKPVAGPTMPPAYPPTYDPRAHYDDSDDDDVGPRPLPAGVGFAERDAVKEFMAKEEKRRKEVEEAAKPKAPKRDEWMLVPPTSSVLGTQSAAIRAQRAPSRSTDNTLWTETPAERQQRLADEVSGKKRRAANSGPAVSPAEELEARKRRRIDEELRAGVEEHTRRTRGLPWWTCMRRAGRARGMGEKEDERKGIGSVIAIWR